MASARPARARRRARSAGFTLLEVIIAVFLFGSVIGLLIEYVSDNLRRLSAARDELVANELAQQTLREVAGRIESGEKVANESGRYEKPDYMRYELSVEPYTIALPADVKEDKSGPLSVIFTPRIQSREPATPLRRVLLRVFREELGPESAVPLIALVALPPPPPPAGGGANSEDARRRNSAGGTQGARSGAQRPGGAQGQPQPPGGRQ